MLIPGDLSNVMGWLSPYELPFVWCPDFPLLVIIHAYSVLHLFVFLSHILPHTISSYISHHRHTLSNIFPTSPWPLHLQFLPLHMASPYITTSPCTYLALNSLIHHPHPPHTDHYIPCPSTFSTSTCLSIQHHTTAHPHIPSLPFPSTLSISHLPYITTSLPLHFLCPHSLSTHHTSPRAFPSTLSPANEGNWRTRHICT